MAAEQPPPPGVAAKPATLPPNRTLYVRNIYTRIPKDDTKRSLYMLFATYGVVLDVVALKTHQMRGQAHVVFRDMDAATQAMRALNDFEFFGRKIEVQYAKGQSNIIPKLKGIIPGAEKAAAAAAAEAAEKQNASTTGFGAAPAKAVPVNEQDRAQGVKRAREDDDEEDAKPTQKQPNNDESDEEEAEMDMSSSDEDD
ncbi:unnamed protein product [Periconia digitata]|uniref:RRM domain-containing protein n=1 Tax=Periconia digitata TaxID=1303443 RepID=A0A9W4XUU8_9PLEO|nr:unnamed protein product [Periconia digitata]